MHDININDEDNRLKKFLSEIDERPYYNFHQQSPRDAPVFSGVYEKEKLSWSDDGKTDSGRKNIEQ